MDLPFDPTAYGRATAQEYDDLHDDLDPSAAVELLAGLADGGPVLELGIGTGRLALPLHARGLEVHGIEGSPVMVEQLHAKPGGADVPVTIGDFAVVDAPGTGYAVAALVFNTIFALPDQDAQVACFVNVARHLRPGGAFVVEAWVPDLGAFRGGRAVRPVRVREDRVVLEAAEVAPARQLMRTTKVVLQAGGTRMIPANHRYAWPSELDLMARLAGLRLEHRWEDWGRRAFGDTSTAHVSVYRSSGG